MVNQAEIHKKAISDDLEERREAVYQLRFSFSVLPDKEQAWEDLHRLTKDKDSHVRRRAADALGTAFSHVPDKEKAWEDLIRLTKDEDRDVRRRAADALGTAFSHVPDKEKAWENLHRLTQDKAIHVRWRAADALGTAFSHVPDKEKAWEDLHRLTKDKNSDVRWGATGALGTAFSHVPDKEKAWENLHRLTQDKAIHVRWRAADALGTAFSHVPDKEKAWEDLIRLAQDEESVQASANHSLGSASIFKATEAESEDDFRKELERALEFFERSSKEVFFNPSNFCLPFYKSFYTITFKKQEAEAEVQKYLAEAKKASEGSESKEKLLEAIENLANALKEVQKTQDFDTLKIGLNTYRQYCERAADLLKETREKAPGATKVLEKGVPIIGERIKEIIAEIQGRAKIACQRSKGTPAEDIACFIHQEVQKWRISDQEQMTRKVDYLIFSLESKIPPLPENEPIRKKIEEIRKERDLVKQYEIIALLIALIPTVHIKISEDMERLEKKLDEIMVSLKYGIREELTITVGAEILGTGARHVITIPLQEITYPDLENDLKNMGKGMLKLETLPSKLANKVKDYLRRNKKDELLKYSN